MNIKNENENNNFTVKSGQKLYVTYQETINSYVYLFLHLLYHPLFPVLDEKKINSWKM